MAWPRTSALDLVLAATVTAMGAVEVAVGQISRPLWATVPSVVLFGIPLLIRRTRPWTALLLAFGTIFALFLAGADQYNYLASVASALLVLFAFAAAVDLAQAVAGLVLAATLLTVSALQGLASVVWGVGLLVGAWAAGRAIRARRVLIEELARTTEELRLSREQHARDAVVAERARIARELHDVIAHSVGVMVIQAGAAERTIASSPDRATAAVQAAQECGRQALADLRRLLGVLRPDDDAADVPRTPQPGLADLPALLDRFRDAGLAVRMTSSGTPRPLSPGVDLAAYRIVQEALTNVLKHAGAPSASVRVAHAGDAVEIEVADDGADVARDPGPGTGHGLVGMRERALLSGGSFAAGPREGGGFAVRVQLPATES